MYCYASHNYRDFAHAGTKAKSDMERIMREDGFKNVALKQTHYKNKVAAFAATLLGMIVAPFRLHRGDILVLQYPLKKYYVYICRAAHRRGAKVVTLVHDLGSFRRMKLSEAEDLRRLNHSDYIIALNSNMKQWLEERNCTAKIGTLGIWDYLSDAVAPERNEMHERPSVVYAGSLQRRKNAFLYEIAASEHKYDLELFGRGFDSQEIKCDSMKYHGFVSENELISSGIGDFGLVWDGDSLETCEGSFGGYLRYNNPHKASLYIRCLLPLIVWDKAGIAGFVKEKGIGLCVGSLADLDEILPSLSQEVYGKMKSKLENLSRDISRGKYFRAALKEATSVLQDNC